MSIRSIGFHFDGCRKNRNENGILIWFDEFVVKHCNCDCNWPQKKQIEFTAMELVLHYVNCCVWPFNVFDALSCDIT